MSQSSTPMLRAFVIGPIGDRDAAEGSDAQISYEQGIEVLEKVIVPACNALDIEAFRADQIATTGDIHEQVFRNLRDAHIVIADLTNANPNVMYELGLRHTTGKLTLQIGERSRLPFDISTIRTILFKRSNLGLIEAKRGLIRAIADGLETGGDPVTATRIWFEIPDHESLSDDSSRSDAGISDGEAGFLELLSDTEIGLSEINQTLSTGASILDEVSEALQKGTDRVSKIPMSSNYSTSKMIAANEVAQSLEDPALRLSIVAKDYSSHVARSNPGMIYLLNSLIDSPEQLADAGDFPSAISLLVDAAAEQISLSASFIEALNNGGRATRSMRRVNSSIARSMEVIRDNSAVILKWGDLLDQLPLRSQDQ